MTIRKSDKTNREIFLTVAAPVQPYGCTPWTLSKLLEKTLDESYTQILRAVLNKSWKRHFAKRHLFGYLPPISQIIRKRRAKHAVLCWKSKDELIS